MFARRLLISIAVILLSASPAAAEELPHAKGWRLTRVEPAEESGSGEFFGLTPPDGRPAVTIDGQLASRLRAGELDPEAAYSGQARGSRTEGEEFVYGKQGKALTSAGGNGSPGAEPDAAVASQESESSPKENSAPAPFSSSLGTLQKKGISPDPSGTFRVPGSVTGGNASGAGYPEDAVSPGVAPATAPPRAAEGTPPSPASPPAKIYDMAAANARYSQQFQVQHGGPDPDSLKANGGGTGNGGGYEGDAGHGNGDDSAAASAAVEASASADDAGANYQHGEQAAAGEPGAKTMTALFADARSCGTEDGSAQNSMNRKVVIEVEYSREGTSWKPKSARLVRNHCAPANTPLRLEQLQFSGSALIFAGQSFERIR